MNLISALLTFLLFYSSSVPLVIFQFFVHSTASIWGEFEQSTSEAWWCEEKSSSVRGNYSTQDQTHGNEAFLAELFFPHLNDHYARSTDISGFKPFNISSL